MKHAVSLPRLPGILCAALLCVLLCLRVSAAETVPSDGAAPTGTPGTVTLSDTKLVMRVDYPYRLTGTPVPSDGVVKWSIPDTSVIRFPGSGTTVTGQEVTVYGVAPGRAVLSAQLEAGGPVATCEAAVSGIVLSETEITMPVSSYENLGYVTYGDAESIGADEWSWNSNNTGVVRFTKQDNGVRLQAVAEGTATISVSGGGYSAIPCRVTVVPNDSSTIKATLEGGILRFSTITNGIRTRCRQITGEELSYIASLNVNTTRGTLYDGYVSEGDTGHGVASTQRYYYGSGTYLIDNITFVPKASVSGEVVITYTGYSVGGTTFNGRIVVTVEGTPATLAYASPKGDPIKFRGEDFSAYCVEVTNRALQYVTFTLPAASYGTLYYKYQSDIVYESLVNSTARYYRSANPAIDSVTFVPAPGYNGTFSLSFTGADTEGKTFSGLARITVTNNEKTGTTGTAAVSGDIAYTVQRGRSVSFRTADFTDLCLSRLNTTLDRIRFDALPAEARGILYYNGDAEVRTTVSYYRSGSGRRIADLSFTAGPSYTGTFTIPFTGYDTDGGTFDGTIAMTVTATGTGSASADSAIYHTTGPAVALSGADIVAQAGYVLDNVSTIRLYDPPATAGRLVLQYVSPGVYTPFDSSQAYEPAELNKVFFLPKAGFEGTVTMTFVARDSMGTVYSSVFRVEVTPPTSSAYFSDLSGRSWAIPAVDFFRHYRVLNGTTPTTYSPDGAARRGQFIAVLGRMFDFPTVYTSPWLTDVPQNMYYAPYFASAVNLGIITPTWDNRVYPDAPITREDAAVYLYRCLKRAGIAKEGDESDLRVFSDWGQIDFYAREAMASMVRMGVFQGDENRRLHPYGALTRLQMAAILYRAMT